ncbi:acyl-CoA thioester hydrolase/BAAT C-terminal domain-containing protein [Streptomyces montanisoli]|uniref:acyl-CoA thioester hydrolase/BAAT C-terminal domain-containing protein n=1 Tax=Streptomyces montanisoli TaxID=2798581 RepID=UPI0027DDC8A9|nr:acyl-CoA thioester hydrolase/BAAT C-terminal domain-containing protein [Streptomyces montanisoli]
MTVRHLSDPWEGVLAEPEEGADRAVLVLGGSGGEIAGERCSLLAAAGLTALSVRWFGGPGQPPGICEVALETFSAAVDLLLRRGARQVGVLGESKGAEAALLLAVHDARVAAVVAISPTSLVWANLGPGADGRSHPPRSSWLHRGAALPFTPYDAAYLPQPPGTGPARLRELYEHSARTYPGRAAEAAIAVERTTARLVLVAGGADAMWPSLPYARELEERVRRGGGTAVVVTDPGAGHHPLLPGEAPLGAAPLYALGGDPRSDAALGAAAWPHILSALGVIPETA